ncbi:MAG: hypothetical protein QOF73_4087, partial [Thermomicrobiales bacterium]|nr:hypothetical protein [Thermomicrobiales bacterium]
ATPPFWSIRYVVSSFLLHATKAPRPRWRAGGYAICRPICQVGDIQTGQGGDGMPLPTPVEPPRSLTRPTEELASLAPLDQSASIHVFSCQQTAKGSVRMGKRRYCPSMRRQSCATGRDGNQIRSTSHRGLRCSASVGSQGNSMPCPPRKRAMTLRAGCTVLLRRTAATQPNHKSDCPDHSPAPIHPLQLPHQAPGQQRHTDDQRAILGNYQGQVDALLDEVAEAYERDRGQGMTKATFGKE